MKIENKQITKIGLTALSFLLLFVVLNILPIIPTKYNITSPPLDNHPENRLCPLNYLLCLNTMYTDNFPSILKKSYMTLFIFPILLPTLLTILVYLKIIKKKFQK